MTEEILTRFYTKWRSVTKVVSWSPVDPIKHFPLSVFQLRVSEREFTLITLIERILPNLTC